METPDARGQGTATRFLGILEKNRKKVAPGLPSDLLAEIAQIEEENQFDDDRKKARQNLRESVEHAARSIRRVEAVEL